jgi:hypothetical protein
MIETVSILNERIEVINNEIMEIKVQIAKTDSTIDLSRLCEEMQHMINCLNENYKKVTELERNEISNKETETGTEETICLCDVERIGIHKYVNKNIRLTSDILSWNAERVIKRAGAEGTLISLHNIYNQAIVRIGKRNYDINFSDFEVIL